MKIILASCQNKYCGLGQYTQHLATALKSLGHTPQVYRKDHEEPPLFRAYPYRSFKSLRPYIAPYYLSRSLRTEEAEVWQTDYVDAAMGALLAGKKEQLFVTVHDAIPFVYSSSRTAFTIYKYELARSLKRAKAIVTVSEHAKQELLKYTNVSPQKVFAVHNGIDHSRYYPTTVTQKNEQFTIKYLGGLGVPHKNAKVLLETARLLRNRCIPFRMEIGGYLPDDHPLRSFAQNHQLKDVHFTGFVPEEAMREFYQTADLFFFPSLLEGFGFPPLEAMASGTPALVSDIPVLREILGEAAFYSEPTANHFAEKITILRQSPHELAEKRELAIAQAQQYTWEKTARAMIHLYEQSA
uniref:Glycosyltransferase family 1 protein n=1 Tax=Roseihalotalea indica TaxID=2867963 RepID=A0AA49GLN1_9BACT|nr:glycosyltransferase family 1 protein [Tunicatimonas sp. TK19036]